MGNSVNTRSENLDILHAVTSQRGASASMVTMLEHIMAAESRGKRYAANDSSTARGCFQFINSTWLGMLKTHGAKFGHGQYASAIRMTKDGWTIDDPALKRQALDLRYDVKLSCQMGVQLAYDNQSALENGLNRKPSAGELYLAHFLGSGGALKVLKHPEPNAKISSFLSADVIDSNSYNPKTKKKGVTLRRGGKETDFRDFTVADIQQWAAGKMEQELSYEQLSEQNRRASWRRRHPRAQPLPAGQEDDYSDMVEARGEMTMVEAILQFVVGIFTAIGSILGISSDKPDGAPQTPSTETAAAGKPAPARA